MPFDHTKAPFPWFGGKSKAAPAVWAALGNVEHYVEPFFGSGAVLLNRPHPANRTYYSETVNDLDGLVCNVWRAIRDHPDETAYHATYPVIESDLTARHCAIVAWRESGAAEHLAGDPDYCDPRIAGWWLWGICCWIGSGWCHGANGPWWPDERGHLTHRRDRTPTDPNEPGVPRKRPHLGNDGQGVNHAGLREPGVPRQRPHLGNNGQGVNAPQLRDPGVSRQLPHLGDDGRGVNAPQLRDPGVSRQLPHLGDDGQGVNHAGLREPGVDDGGVWGHIDRPKLDAWIAALGRRLVNVRVLNGQWANVLTQHRRLLTGGATQTLSVRQGGTCGVFLDPPYADTAARADDLYAVDSLMVAHDVRDWCLEHGDNPTYRIVLAGFDGEHGTQLADAGWHTQEWFTDGWLTGGMANTGADDHQQARERLWLSPHCLWPGRDHGQQTMFTGDPHPIHPH